MKLLNDKNLKLYAVITLSILLGFVLVSQVIVMYMAKDYKSTMLKHDYAVAGYLTRNGIDKHKIVSAFTSNKINADTLKGSSLLTASGYSERMQSSLLPEAKLFHEKYAFIWLIISIFFFLLLLIVFINYLVQHNKRLEKARENINCFMEGDTSIRLEDGSEDNLSQLFAAVNSMATSLTAHIEKEKHNREFLKVTISDISHQLKTPLAALQMYNEIIIEEETDNEVIESFTAKSNREILRMENLIQNLLKLTRLDAGTIELEKNVHKLKSFLEKCHSFFATRAEMEGKIITLRCDDSITLPFDEMWLSEAVGNIIKNAFDHTEGGNKIEISCIETVLAIEIIIKDNGAGIHEEDIHHIFKRFYRSRYSKDKHGIGIGLALSKAIVEKHGGTITVQSKLSCGCEFHMIFPKLSTL